MNATERRATWSLASIYSLRMLGLFMLFPVLALHTDGLPQSTPLLAGLALGMYGLTQALLQVPAGFLSDHIGRKPVIVFGLILFAAGSLIAGGAETIWGVILGRAIQGAGAIAAAIMALLADLTREEQRTKAMAVIGMSIGASYLAALILGPVLSQWVGVTGIFYLTAAVALGMIVLVILLVPNPVSHRRHTDTQVSPGQITRVLADQQLLRLDASILLLHLVMTANFVALPLVLQDRMGLPGQHHWWLYLPVILLSLVGMVPMIVLAERGKKLKPVFLVSVAGIGMAELLFGLTETSIGMLFGSLLLFFVGFNVLEACLPSLISKVAPRTAKGTALGAYSTAQFLGAFLGGLGGGFVHGIWGANGIFWCCAVVSVAWLIIVSGLRAPRPLLTKTIKVGTIQPDQARELVTELLSISGVEEAILGEDGIAYLRVDDTTFDPKMVESYSVAQ